MNILKDNKLVQILETIAVFWLAKTLIIKTAADFHFAYPSIPIITLAQGSLFVTYTTTIIFLLYRTKIKPYFYFGKEVLLYSALGIIIIWLSHGVLALIYVNANNSSVIEFVNYKDSYKYINLLSIIILIPITEEILFRGYLINILKKTGVLVSLLVTSVLFVTVHLIFHKYGSPLGMLVNGIYIFFFSMTVGFAYIRAGLMAAILVHIFNNLYVIVTNT